jgi:hypothetical protein
MKVRVDHAFQLRVGTGFESFHLTYLRPDMIL